MIDRNPPNSSSGSGVAAIKLEGDVLSWVITYSGLTGPVTGAHFHGPAAANANAGVIVPFAGSLGSPISGSQKLTAPQIAEEARVPIEAFFELFAGRDECFLAAFDKLSDELLLLVADPDLVSSDWPTAVRRTIGKLMRYLAEHPLYAHTIAAEAFAAYTSGVAYQAFEDGEWGQLEVGQRADLVALAAGPMSTPPLEWPEIPVLGTWLGGRRTYG